MNDPWPRLVDALAGKRCPTSNTWPVRKVYRIEGYVSDAVAAKRRAEAPRTLSRHTVDSR